MKTLSRMHKRALFAIALCLIVLGLGCGRKPAPSPAPVPVPSDCPDVCAAVCGGKPEPFVPQGCPMPMCYCEPQPK